MRILGLVFAGTATPHHQAMTSFVSDVLGFRPEPAELVDTAGPAAAAYFDLPDGSRFAVATQRTPEAGTSRTIGFLVENLEESVAELSAAGVEVDEPNESATQRYAHFIAPDGELYELVEHR